jgi:hypothetical protein
MQASDDSCIRRQIVPEAEDSSGCASERITALRLQASNG